jgi:serine/arginine repetitive matrix protein 2
MLMWTCINHYLVFDVDKNSDLVIESDSEEDRSQKEAVSGRDDDIPPVATESEDDELAFEEPLSPTPSEVPQKDLPIPPQESAESADPDHSNIHVLSSSSSTSAITNSQSPDQARISQQRCPTPLSVATRTQGSEKSPLTGDDWEETSSSTKRNGEHASPSTWEKVKGAFARANPSGRRSRSNSLATRERRDNIESSISRESGTSLTSTRAVDGPGHPPLQAPPLMQTPSASTSIHSLSPHMHVPPRNGASPIPAATSADLAKYQNMKLFPFPGFQRLEEQRNKKVAVGGAASLSSPDVSVGVVDEDQPPLSANWSSNTSPRTPDASRERKLSHQASDSKLLPKFNGTANGTPLSLSASRGEYADVVPSQSLSPGGKARPPLPKTLSGVRQWLTKNNKLFSPSLPLAFPQSSSSSGASNTNAPVEPVIVEKGKNNNKKPSLSDIFKKPGAEISVDWEEVGTTPVSVNGDYSFVSGSSNPTSSTTMTAPSTRAVASSSSSDSNERVVPLHLKDERNNARPQTSPAKSLKSKNLAPLELQKLASPRIDDSPSPLSYPPSRSDPLLSSTPDPSSSLSDYPRSTSESSSSSQCSFTPQGSVVIDKLDENLLRGSRNPRLTSIIDEPPRRSVLTWSVYQVVNQRTVKDRFLFLFKDLLVIAKPKLSSHENLVDFKASSPGRLFVVKNVILLKDIRFTPGRTDTTLRSPSLKEQPVKKNPIIKDFVSQFALHPEGAVKSLVLKYRVLEDPRRLGRFIFHTIELDRARVGEYLSKKAHKQELDAYLNNFGFVGVRIDRALRAFLLSINVPVQNSSALDNLLYAFAGSWYDANARFVAYDRNMAGRLVLALVRLNMILHGDLAETPGPTGYPVEDFPLRDWNNLVRRADPRQLLPIDLLEGLYDSIRQEKLCQACSYNGRESAIQPITIRKSVPSRLTYKTQSDPVILRIPAPDPNLTIYLFGKDLLFDPPVLSFTKSSEASFRIIGNELGLKTMIMCRSGANALKYAGLPLSNTLVVERAFMRNTFQIAFTDHRSMKRRYMFSVADPVLALNVRTSIERAASSVNSVPSASPEINKYMRVAEQVAFRILQCTLIDGPDFVRSNKPSAQPDSSLPSKIETNGAANSFRYPKHGRSKSRSQLYRHDAGQNELDLSYDSTSYSDFRDSDLSDVNDETELPAGPIWSGEELVAQCQQNSAVPTILSLLQIGVIGKETVQPL